MSDSFVASSWADMYDVGYIHLVVKANTQAAISPVCNVLVTRQPSYRLVRRLIPSPCLGTRQFRAAEDTRFETFRNIVSASGFAAKRETSNKILKGRSSSAHLQK
jgi:hypothetical protein